MSEQPVSKPSVFEGKRIRKTLHEDEWWFSIIDVIEVLVGGDRPCKYWSDLKQKLIAEGYVEVSEKIGHFKMLAPVGRPDAGHHRLPAGSAAHHPRNRASAQSAGFNAGLGNRYSVCRRWQSIARNLRTKQPPAKAGGF